MHQVVVKLTILLPENHYFFTT